MTYKIVGKPLLRTDVPAKCTGRRQYVHDVKLAGMCMRAWFGHRRWGRNCSLSMSHRSPRSPAFGW